MLACVASPADSGREELPAPEPVAVAYPVDPTPTLPALEPGHAVPVELLGELFLDPFGNGGRFITAHGEQLELESAWPRLLVHHGRRVRARGQLWACEGDRVFAPRELELLEPQSAQLEPELPPPPWVRSAAQLDGLRSPWFRVIAEVWLPGSERAWLRLDDGSALAVALDQRAGLELRMGQRVSLILERRELPLVLAGCLGAHERCEPAPELGHSSRFSADMCMRVQALGGSRSSTN